jgi:hypothetical protein
MFSEIAEATVVLDLEEAVVELLVAFDVALEELVVPDDVAELDAALVGENVLLLTPKPIFAA